MVVANQTNSYFGQTDLLLIQILYNLSIRLFGAVLWLLGLFNKHIRAWNTERNAITNIPKASIGQKVIWVHCASLGEYEQILPLLKSIKASAPHFSIYLSFFSPSGYQIKKNSSIADVVFYLPLDVSSKMKAIVESIKPTIFIGVKYEFWWNMLAALEAYKTTIIYTNVAFTKRPYFLSVLFSSFKKRLASIDYIFTQDSNTHDMLSKAGLTNLKVSGDMRIDNVLSRKSNLNNLEELDVLGLNKVFVWGSVYKEDIFLINKVIDRMPEFTHFVVPHHVDANTINVFARKIRSNSQKWSDGRLNQKVVIVDVIGVLFDLYAKADLAYVGGGHVGRLHNVLEPSAFKIPVYYKDNIARHPEAIELTSLGLHKAVLKAKDVVDHFQNHPPDSIGSDFEERYDAYFNRHKGTAEQVFDAISSDLKL